MSISKVIVNRAWLHDACEILTSQTSYLLWPLKQQKKELPPFSAYRLLAATNIFLFVRTSYHGIALCTQSLPVIFFLTVLISILNDAKLRLI